MNLNEYLNNVNNLYKSGRATEHSYRGDLAQLIQTIVPNATITNEPRRIECGAPDYIITKKDIPIGYIEAKDIGVSLDATEKSEQLKRYLKSLNNLILTDYLEFRFFRNGVKVKTLSLAEIIDEKIKANKASFNEFTDLISDFSLFVSQNITSAEVLAKLMAGKARMLESVFEQALIADIADKLNPDTALQQQYKAFKDVLIHDLSPKAFADIYAQTIAYGMFAARLHDTTQNDFSRFEAASLIPTSNPLLRKLFQYIAGYDLDDRIAWIVDALADIFLHTDVKVVLKDFGLSDEMNDPMIHFYETFLAEYDPKLRKKRGVYYTPEPVVNFIVRAVDDILKTEFNLPQGLADTSKTTIEVNTQEQDKRSVTGYKRAKKEVHKVQILDPATGTGTFLAEVVKNIYKRFEGQQGIWSNYVDNHLIPRLNGFELLMASYSMAHLKLDLLLKETGYTSQSNQRFKIYLTNSLEEHHPDTGTLFAGWLSSEANEANHIKRDTPVMVVLGNPPYSGESSNKGKWIMDLLEDYKKEPGGKEKLKERNPKWINDDYVKFIRYGQYFINKNGEGILAFINPHGYLGNPTFRGMRWSLLKTFDSIYTIDLHGNSKIKEVCPDGSPDKNVFDIQQGVSINIFVKTGKKTVNNLADVYHCDLYGKRESKYKFLFANKINSVDFSHVKLVHPNYYFKIKNWELESQYNNGISLKELFIKSTIGVQTHRDNLVIDFNKEDLIDRFKEIFSNDDTNQLISKFEIKESNNWDLASSLIAEKKFKQSDVITINYRAFDNRFIYYNDTFVDRTRRSVGKEVKNDNLVINFPKIVKVEWNHSLITKTIPTAISMDINGSYFAPLYLNSFSDDQQIIDHESGGKRIPNLKKEIVGEIAIKLDLIFNNEKKELKGTFAPIDILDYIYAVLHSPSYRDKYKEFLKNDFPWVPYPEKETFWQLVELGGQLRQLHLLESPKVMQFITSYPINGSNIVTRSIVKKDWEIRDSEKQLGRVWINDQQYFDKVPEIAWNFYIGGYQPAQKWLKDRKGRELSFEDIMHYQKIIVALTETDRLMKEIDIII